MSSSSLVVRCPTCGAAAKTNGFGRDGSPREMAPYATPLSGDPLVSVRRERARRIRWRNASGGGHRIDAEVRRAMA